MTRTLKPKRWRAGRASQLKTPIAKLREFLEKKHAEENLPFKPAHLADLLGVKKYTINSLESGRLNLTIDNACRLAHETGISVSWLINGNPNTRMRNESDGGPYTFDSFKSARRNLKRLNTADRARACIFLNFRLRGILANALARGDLALVLYKLHAVLRKLEAEFQTDLAFRFLPDASSIPYLLTSLKKMDKKDLRIILESARVKK